jgi:hypothetical protein
MHAFGGEGRDEMQLIESRIRPIAHAGVAESAALIRGFKDSRMRDSGTSDSGSVLRDERFRGVV